MREVVDEVVGGEGAVGRRGARTLRQVHPQDPFTHKSMAANSILFAHLWTHTPWGVRADVKSNEPS